MTPLEVNYSSMESTEAIDLLEQGFEECIKSRDTVYICNYFAGLSYLYFERKDYSKCDAIFKQALEFTKDTANIPVEHFVTALNNVNFIESKKGNILEG